MVIEDKLCTKIISLMDPVFYTCAGCRKSKRPGCNTERYKIGRVFNGNIILKECILHLNTSLLTVNNAP